MGIIEATGLTRKYGAVTAVEGLDLDVREGSVTGFLGPNGAGKTTTIRMLLGLVHPTAGSVRVCGQPVVFGQSARPQQVAAIVETPAFYGALSAIENLRVLSLTAGLRLSQTQLEKQLERLGLAGRGHESVRGFSLVVWSGLATALGWLLPMPTETPLEVSPHLYRVLGSVLRVISLSPSIMLVTLLARSNGTLVGSLTGVLAPLAVNLTALWQEPSLNRLTPVFTSDALVLRLSEAPGAAEAADRLVGASFGSLACVLVLLAWLVLPLVGACWHFERRDVLSESE